MSVGGLAATNRPGSGVPAPPAGASAVYSDYSFCLIVSIVSCKEIQFGVPFAVIHQEKKIID